MLNDIQKEMREAIVADIVENTDLPADAVRSALTIGGPVRRSGETWTSFTWVEEDGHAEILIRFDLISRSYVIE